MNACACASELRYASPAAIVQHAILQHAVHTRGEGRDFDIFILKTFEARSL